MIRVGEFGARVMRELELPPVTAKPAPTPAPAPDAFPHCAVCECPLSPDRFMRCRVCHELLCHAKGCLTQHFNEHTAQEAAATKGVTA